MNISPLDPLRLDISLWSADLANLGRDIRRLEPVADSFHLDACDGHYAPTLLFFPDLVARIRQLTTKPLHLHLMATRPMDLLPAFLEHRFRPHPRVSHHPRGPPARHALGAPLLGELNGPA